MVWCTGSKQFRPRDENESVKSTRKQKSAANRGRSSRQLGRRARAARPRRVRVPRELDRLAVLQPERILKASANLDQDLAADVRGAALAAGAGAVATAGERLARAAGPQADAVEAFPHVDDDAHDLAVLLVFERLADGGQHDVQPDVVDVDGFAVAELEGPLAAVLVLRVLPLRSHAGFEEVVVGLLG